MSNSTDTNEINIGSIQITTELLIRGIIGLTLAIFITCGTTINKNSKFEILLMKTTIVKTIMTLGLTILAVIISSYLALGIIFLLSFAFYWMVHGVKIYQNDISNNDQKVIDDLNIKGNVLFTPESTSDEDEEKQPLLNNIKNNSKELIINGINDAMSIISNHSSLSKLSKGIGSIIDNHSKIKSNSPSPISRKSNISPLLQSFISNQSLNQDNYENTISNLSKDGFPTFDKRLLSTSSDNLLNKKRRNSTPKRITYTHKSDDDLNNNF